MDQSSSDATNEKGVIDFQFDSVLELLISLLKHGVEALGLRYGTRESVENETMVKQW